MRTPDEYRSAAEYLTSPAGGRLSCSSAEELEEWLGSRDVIRTQYGMAGLSAAFCGDACADWCISKLAAKRCGHPQRAIVNLQREEEA